MTVDPITPPLRRSTFIPAPGNVREEPFRTYAREVSESVSAVHGLMFASLFSAPIIVGIAVVLLWPR